MLRLRFKLSSLLIAIAFVAVAIGLGYRIHVLNIQVADLKSELARVLPQRSVRVTYLNVPSQPLGTPAKQSPFRLLDTDIIMHSSIEDGMKADEWELQQRLHRELKRDQSDTPIEAGPQRVPRSW